MTNLVGYIKRHQLIAYFVLTYIITWGLLFSIQPLYLQGHRILAPLISLGVFGPALASIGLSAILKPQPRKGSRKPAMVAFIIAWIVASIIIILQLTVNQGMDWSATLVMVCVITALLPAFIVSSVFSTYPGVSALLRTYRKPRGSPAYYLLALLLFPTIWILGNLFSRALGMRVPFSPYPGLDFKLVGMVLITFLYGIIYAGLTEEPGWRGFALPRLQAKRSPLVSSLILGAIWAVWHAPGRFGGIEAKSIADTLVEWILILIVTVIFTWIFNHTKGSILVTALIHPAMNTATSYLRASLGAILLLVGFMVFVIVFDKMWRRLPDDHEAVYSVEQSGILQNPQQA